MSNLTNIFLLTILKHILTCCGPNKDFSHPDSLSGPAALQRDSLSNFLSESYSSNQSEEAQGWAESSIGVQW